ncbi:MAG TPA: hypothetical protein PLI95_26400 [Polyangiaceae bacterium]|nr:hypothetical protein [Polyangiaceae bacterium]
MTPNRFEEGELRFDFDGTWTVSKWDDSNAYRQGIQRLEGTKAVDFVCVRDTPGGNQSVFIEVKDFRKEPARNKRRIETELPQEVAEKVRDTLSGLAGAHVSRRTEDWQPWLAFVSQRRNPYVVLWMEEVPPFPGHGNRQVWEQRAKAHGTTLVQQLKKRVSWLTKRVCVYSTKGGGGLPGLQVSNLPGAGSPP